ncbi:MAG: Glycerol-3-phosphate dehydrogenase [NAD(P)+] [Chlamydiia bacterium]|nr:Glycerol-3-phosphate dehydrogenase [NAD(P)+] [Chlamydiia bacterium]
MKVCMLGSGVWAFAQADVISANVDEVVMWSIEEDVVQSINATGEHPRFPGARVARNVRVVTSMAEAIEGADVIVECVTTRGLRSVMGQLKELGTCTCPIVVTSKGIEQDSMLLSSQIVTDVLGEEIKNQLVCLSGPSLATEVMAKQPSSVVVAGYNSEMLEPVMKAYSTSYFRVYTNDDVMGVSVGGAMKNVIAIAAGICKGIKLQMNSKTALITRGLHEIRKLGVAMGAKAETFNGLSGIGDLCVTCLSDDSRNCRYGQLLGAGLSGSEAQKQIGMVVEGVNTVISAMQLSRKYNIEMPITEMVNAIINEGLSAQEAIKMLINRATKNEMD